MFVVTTANRQNKLYLAFRELGRVERKLANITQVRVITVSDGLFSTLFDGYAAARRRAGGSRYLMDCFSRFLMGMQPPGDALVSERLRSKFVIGGRTGISE